MVEDNCDEQSNWLVKSGTGCIWNEDGHDAIH